MVVILAALTLSASFYPLNLWWAAIIAYLLFFISLKRSTYPVVSAFIFGFLAHLLILHWSGTYVGALPWIALSVLHGLFFMAVGIIFKIKGSIAILLPGLLLIEEIRSRFPFGGFGWTRIGFSQSEAPYLPLVSLGGVALLSLVVLLISFLLLHINHTSIGAIILIVGAPLLLTNVSTNSTSIDVVAIQGNTPSVGLTFNERARGVLNLHIDQTRKKVIGKPDVIVWPENAIDIDPITNQDVALDIAKLTSEFRAPLLAGAVMKNQGNLVNASILFGIDGKPESIYRKRYLTPFGEYIPIRPIAELLSPYASGIVDFKPGDRLVVHQVKGLNIAPVICYELLNDGLLRESAKNSDLFVVQTNSATFAGTTEPKQQFAMTRIRAVEHNRNIIAISTVGISGFIDNNGAILKKVEENVPQSISGQMYGNSNITLVDRLGGFAVVLVIMLAFILCRYLRRFE